jgi:hypothetical protein
MKAVLNTLQCLFMLKKEKEKSETRIGFDETLWYFVWKH